MTRVALGTHSSSTPGSCWSVAAWRIFLDTCSQVPLKGPSSAFGDEHQLTVQPFWDYTAVPTGLSSVGGFWDPVAVPILALSATCPTAAHMQESLRITPCLGSKANVIQLLFLLSSYLFCFNFRRISRSLKTLRLTYPHRHHVCTRPTL